MGLFHANYDRPGPGIEKNAPQKKGLPLFFSLYFDNFWDLMKLDLVFLLCCLPVVTIPAAWAAMTRVACCVAGDKVYFFGEEFKTAFLKNWKQATLYGFGWAALLGVSLFSAWFYGKTFADNQTLALVFSAIFSLVILALFFNGFFFYPILVLVEQPMKAMLRNASLLSMAALKNTLAMLAPVAVLVVAAVLLYPISLFFLPFLPSTVCFILAFGCLGPVRRYVLQVDVPEESEESVLP